MLIDSHHHLWRYASSDYGWISDKMSVLRNDFLVDELKEIAASHSVDGFVTVQARQTLEETSWLLELAEHSNLIRGVVGWLPLASSQLEGELERFAPSAWLKGIRHVVQDEPDDRFLLNDDFNRGVAKLLPHKLVYDVLIFARQLPAAIEFVDRHPNQLFVLDHIGKPTITGENVDPLWEQGFRDLAKRENVHCKFSGVVTEITDNSWTTAIVRSYWNVALEAFGIQRLMFGSDWPVCLLRTDYSRWLETVRTLSAELSQQEQSAFFADNAIQIYNL